MRWIVCFAAHALTGGSVISAGGTGTYHLHSRVTEVQAGSYALMDSYYARLGHPFEQAAHVYGTVVSATPKFAVADVGLKSMGMDHGNPTVETLDGQGADVWFLSDEHITFVPHTGVVAVGDRVRVVPAHIDPTMAMHEVAWLARGHEVIDRWPIDLRQLVTVLDLVWWAAIGLLVLLCVTQWLGFDGSKPVAILQSLSLYALACAAPLGVLAAVDGRWVIAALCRAPLTTLAWLTIPVRTRSIQLRRRSAVHRRVRQPAGQEPTARPTPWRRWPPPVPTCW